VVTLDVHNVAAFQNAFRCATESLHAGRLFADHFAALLGRSEVAVVSPDAGGVGRAERLRGMLATRLGREVTTAFLVKHRSAGIVSGGALVGDVRGRVAVVVEIATGTTLVLAARACREAGAARVFAAATHGLFVGGAGEVLADEALEQVAVTSTIPPFRLGPGAALEKLVVLDAAPLVGEAIRRLHEGGSIVELLEDRAPRT
jgi:ribose-phosphate pyrophosphokinase